MDVTLTLGEMGLILIFGALFILLIYIIILVKNLVPSIKTLAKILSNVEVVTDSAAKGSKEAETLIKDFSGAADVFISSIKGNQSTINAVTSLINAISSLKSFFERQK